MEQEKGDRGLRVLQAQNGAGIRPAQQWGACPNATHSLKAGSSRRTLATSLCKPIVYVINVILFAFRKEPITYVNVLFTLN
jgi:hypothetical protein